MRTKGSAGRIWFGVVELALMAGMALAVLSRPVTARHHLLMAILAVALLWCLVRPKNFQRWGRLALAFTVMFLFSLSLTARLPESLDWRWTGPDFVGASLLVWIAVGGWILGSWRAGRLSLKDRWGYSASGLPVAALPVAALLAVGLLAMLMVILFLAFGERYLIDPESEWHLGHQIAQYVALLLICLTGLEEKARLRRITVAAVVVLGLKLLLDWL